MYQCSTCGAPISPNAPICFNCGETTMNAEGGCMLLTAVLVVLMMALCAGAL
ncbi:MAG: zinc-ribbon domain-containing protein [Gemmataceae bacterium]|nr:zinc-ribbon domain-containing protein [Gemmataceae bacterium]